VIDKMIHTIRTANNSTPKDNNLIPIQIERGMNDKTANEILNDIEIWINPIKDIVRKLHPILPDFGKVAAVAAWSFRTPLSRNESVPKYSDAEYTYVDPVSMEKIINSMAETAYDRHRRDKVPVKEFSPGGQYRGKQAG
jgi:hypothetical protein